MVAIEMEDLQKKDLESDTNRYGVLMSELGRNRNNPYCGGIIEKYEGCYPVWAFVEIIPFGSFIHFYGYCAEILEDKKMQNEYYLFQSVKVLRNAVAHNNCILHNMGTKDSAYKANHSVIQALKGISKETKQNKLSNARMQQIITLLYTHSAIVQSGGVKKAEKAKLQEVCERMQQHAEFYVDNDAILTNFDFFIKCVDILYS